MRIKTSHLIIAFQISFAEAEYTATHTCSKKLGACICSMHHGNALLSNANQPGSIGPPPCYHPSLHDLQPFLRHCAAEIKKKLQIIKKPY